jgi:hypothetical protein
MRQKNFYLFHVDVYMAAISLSAAALTALNTKGSTPAIDTILSLDKPQSEVPQPSTIITCRFVRTIGVSTAVEAFDDRFKGLPPDKVNEFRLQMIAALGDDPLQAGDEVMFVWLEGGGLKIVRPGKLGGFIRYEPVERRLLEAYLDPVSSISPQLLNSYLENAGKVLQQD